MDSGFIKLWRETLDSDVFQDDWLFRLFAWCLLRAQWKQVDRVGVPDRGQFFTGRMTGAAELGVEPSKWYRGIVKLCELGCITAESNNQRTTITICNYAIYQDKEEENESQVNSNRTASEQQSNSDRTAIEQPSLEEEGKKERKEPAVSQKFDPLSIVFPTALETPAFRTSWAEWVAYRVERRLSLREKTVAKQISTFASWGEPKAIEAINNSIRNGWAGVFEPRVDGKNKKGSLVDSAREMLDWATAGEEKPNEPS